METKTEELMKIEVSVRTITKEDGETFLAFKGLTKKGWLDLKFTREVKDTPTNYGFIYVKPENVNVNTKSRFPVIWIKAVEKIEIVDFNRKVEDYFDLPEQSE